MASKNEKYSKMEANDAIIAAGIGGGVAVYFYYILGQSSDGLIAESFVRWRWLLLIIFPLLAALGLQIAFLIGKKFPAIYQLAKFLLVGAMAAILDLALLNLFMVLSGAASGAGFNVAKGISFAAATSLKYFPDKLWAFKNKNRQNLKREFGKFFAITLAGLALNIFIADIIVNQIGSQWGIPAELWANLGGIGAIMAVFIFNFFGYKILVFKK
jgi:putative flippase GtrA